MIASRSDLTAVIDLDLRMNGLARWRPHYRLSKGTVYFLRLLRYAEFWDACRDRSPYHRMRAGVARVRLRRQSERLGFEVPLHRVGPGLSIAHSGLLVIASNASLGARCRIHQGVTIGRGVLSAPTLGDDVFVGPNAMVIGDVTIGNGALIYPGAVCLTNVPDGHGARGVPATVVSLDAPSMWRPEGWREH